jgi:hypothetical protein
MAARLDENAIRRAVDRPVYRVAEELLASGQLGEISAVGGGAQSIVSNCAALAGRVRTRVRRGLLPGD